jgi:hypothetical protein
MLVGYGATLRWVRDDPPCEDTREAPEWDERDISAEESAADAEIERRFDEEGLSGVYES